MCPQKSSKAEKAYLAQYNVNLLQKKLDKLMTDYPNIKAALSDDITVKKLLVGNFKYLAKVYSAYTSYLNGKTPEESLLIRSAFVKGDSIMTATRVKLPIS